jgi:hypothetical protein
MAGATLTQGELVRYREAGQFRAVRRCGDLYLGTRSCLLGKRWNGERRKEPTDTPKANAKIHRFNSSLGMGRLSFFLQAHESIVEMFFDVEEEIGCGMC